jgi:acyl-CoA synthetase (AMP-forming)/AMP-acid ligase II
MRLDPRMPRTDECVLRPLLDRRARETPDKVFVVFEDGEQWTYAELRRRVMHVAASLQKAGVEQGDFVLSWQGNGPITLLTWFGLNYLGAVYVPINTSYRGRLLEHVIANSDARLMIADARLIDRLADVDLAQLRRVITVGDTSWQDARLEILPATALTAGPAEPAPLQREIAPWDTQNVIYTSGTTGPSSARPPRGTATIRCARRSSCRWPTTHRIVRRTLRRRCLHAVQHDRDLHAADVGAEPGQGRIVRPATARGSNCAWSTTSTAKCRRQCGRADRAHRSALGDEQRLLQEPGSHGAAWRNGWFHTGDAFRVDDDGTFFLRRPDEGCDPPARREHLVLRGRGRSRAHSRRCARWRCTRCPARSPRTK